MNTSVIDKMRIVCSIAIIFIATICKTEAFVVTKHDPNIIARYFEHIQKYSNRRIPNPFTNRSLFEFCQLLRLSKIFRSVTHDEFYYHINYHYNISEYRISKETLEMEKDQLEIRTKRFRIGTPSRIKWMPSFKCLDENKDLRWYVTPSFIPHSYFFFNYYPEFHYVTSREINTDTEYYPMLIAIIDELAKFTEDSRDDRIDILEKTFTESLIISNRLRTNSICDLNHIMRYRLCAVVAAATRQCWPSEQRNDFISTRTFRRQPETQYYHTNNPIEICPLVSLNGMNVSGRMLRCSTQIIPLGVRYNFFLTYNLNDKSKLYYVKNFETMPRAYIQELEIPLLKYIDDYVDALKYVIN